MKSVLSFLCLASVAHAADLFPFQLPWDDATPGVTSLAVLNAKPAGKDGPVQVKGGHLFAGTERLRIFGVNVCFGANFPDKDLAPKIAARMAKFGINCVRFHHMDMMNTPGGIFAKDGKTLDPGQLDRLDWFIAKLKEQGIYADLNLHVSRTHPDRPKAEKANLPDYDKGVDNFSSAMIALQKDYARDLLTHVNPYTGKSYAEEPAVALVEINNENALGLQWWAGEMEHLPEPYAAEFSGLWTAWLVKKYGSDEKITDAWKEGVKEGGPEVLANGNFSAGMKGWNVEQQGGAEVASEITSKKTLRLEVKKTGKESWHVQFNQAGLKVAAGESYAVTFRGKASKKMSVHVNLMQAHEPWKILGSAQVELTPEWKERRVTFRASAADENARVGLSGFGQTIGTFEFADLSLRTAEVNGQVQRNAAGHIPYLTKAALATRTSQAQRDWQEFMWDTESVYWNGMRDFLKKDLGVKAPIVGTQGFWSPAHVQGGMDVLDSHAYWHHPDFHGRGWNQEVWSVKNESMAGAKNGGTLSGLAAQRVFGKPFICTEYNHSAPNSYSVETFPLVLAFAAQQDWDGVFAFSYSHRGANAWSQDHFDNFFDIDRHAGKMATLPGAVLSFRRGDVPPLPFKAAWTVSKEQAVKEGLRAGPGFANQLDKDLGAKIFSSQVGTALDGKPQTATEASGLVPDYVPALNWDTTAQRAVLATPRSAFVIGKAGAAVSFQRDGGLSVQSGDSRMGWSSFQFSVVEGESFATARRFLITATGEVENTGQAWKDASKTSVGRNWGKAPVLVEGPAAKVELPGKGKFKAWALDERGQRRAEISVSGNMLELGPQHKTLWYEVERE